MSRRKYQARWQGCTGKFKAGVNMTPERNMERHYQKHVINKKSWKRRKRKVTLEDYLQMATDHMNSTANYINEYTDLKYDNIVKVNRRTREVGVACPYTGRIVTFYIIDHHRSNLVYWNLKTGRWGPRMSTYPEIIDPTEEE